MSIADLAGEQIDGEGPGLHSCHEAGAHQATAFYCHDPCIVSGYAGAPEEPLRPKGSERGEVNEDDEVELGHDHDVGNREGLGDEGVVRFVVRTTTPAPA